ncbi:MAG: aldo/keto reductase [Clostridiales Family XIII bacterium]|jgi:diketogulonate reductase-like aldo/keto reductase|nr:aldo/keto reductase [Clostridiales Family XIII bacterium]
MIKIPTKKLNNNIEIPAIGYGVAMLSHGSELDIAIRTAVEAGYRLFDCAPAYENEAEVGKALKDSGVPREEFFISTKLPNLSHAYEDALKAYDKSRIAFDLDYIDEYLIHNPIPAQGLYLEAWRAFEKLYTDGLIRVIGLSNFKVNHMQDVLDHCEIPPMTNEIECNPYYTRIPERSFCKEQGIQPLSWFPLGGPLVGARPHALAEFKVLLQDETVTALADQYEKTPAQIVLRWALENDIVPLPKSAKPARILENIDLFDFELTPAEIGVLDALNHDRRLGPDPDNYVIL